MISPYCFPWVLKDPHNSPSSMGFMLRIGNNILFSYIFVGYSTYVEKLDLLKTPERKQNSTRKVMFDHHHRENSQVISLQIPGSGFHLKKEHQTKQLIITVLFEEITVNNCFVCDFFKKTMNNLKKSQSTLISNPTQWTKRPHLCYQR